MDLTTTDPAAEPRHPAPAVVTLADASVSATTVVTKPGEVTPAARAYRDRDPNPKRWTAAQWENYSELGGIA